MKLVREVILEEIENYFNGKEIANNLTLNTFADIVEDSSDNDDTQEQDVVNKAVIYINKLASSYEPNIFRKSVKEEWTVGIRTSFPDSYMNFERCEILINDLHMYFNNRGNCNGYQINVTTNYEVLSKDNKERYFLEFNIQIKN